MSSSPLSLTTGDATVKKSRRTASVWVTFGYNISNYPRPQSGHQAPDRAPTYDCSQQQAEQQDLGSQESGGVSLKHVTTVTRAV